MWDQRERLGRTVVETIEEGGDWRDRSRIRTGGMFGWRKGTEGDEESLGGQRVRGKEAPSLRKESSRDRG